MSQLVWQKSSFSTGDQGECVELATDHTGTVHLRESDAPDRVTTPARTALAALLATLKRTRRATGCRCPSSPLPNRLAPSCS